MTKNKAVGGFTEDLILLFLLGLAGYAAYKMFFSTTPPPASGGSVLTSAATQNNLNNTAATKAAADSDVAAAKAAGVVQTLNASALAANADSIFQALVNTNGSDFSTAYSLVIQCNNAMDWALLEQAFGSKNINVGSNYSVICATVGLNCTTVGLLEAIQLALTDYNATDPSDAAYWVETFNSFFSDTGIAASVTISN
jgi:hypothetical protein